MLLLLLPGATRHQQTLEQPHQRQVHMTPNSRQGRAAPPNKVSPCLTRAGHARVYVAFDVLYRLMMVGLAYDVQYVRNITDVDDKIITRAAARGQDPAALATAFIREFHQVQLQIQFQLQIDAQRLMPTSCERHSDWGTWSPLVG